MPSNFLFTSLLGNPVGMLRVACLIVLDGKEIFGAAGEARMRWVGGEAAGIGLLLAGLASWIILPILATQSLLKRQDI